MFFFFFILYLNKTEKPVKSSVLRVDILFFKSCYLCKLKATAN